jgi:hypothetical protein
VSVRFPSGMSRGSLPRPLECQVVPSECALRRTLAAVANEYCPWDAWGSIGVRCCGGGGGRGRGGRGGGGLGLDGSSPAVSAASIILRGFVPVRRMCSTKSASTSSYATLSATGAFLPVSSLIFSVANFGRPSLRHAAHDRTPQAARPSSRVCPLEASARNR